VMEEIEEPGMEPPTEEESEVVPPTVGKEVEWEMELPYERAEEEEREEEEEAESEVVLLTVGEEEVEWEVERSS
jgi:hypothetical protein